MLASHADILLARHALLPGVRGRLSRCLFPRTLRPRSDLVPGHGARALKWTLFRHASALNLARSQTTRKRSWRQIWSTDEKLFRLAPVPKFCSGTNKRLCSEWCSVAASLNGSLGDQYSSMAKWNAPSETESDTYLHDIHQRNSCVRE